MQSEVTSKIIDLESIHKLIDSKVSFKSGEEIEFFENVIGGKSTEQIVDTLNTIVNPENVVDLLLVEETNDDGGIIALSGFYFQFLATIEYLIELIDGKWDFILVDHHQDIIAINNEQIRLIQAKTKNVSYCDVSETKLYNDWIQKLFALDEMFFSFECKTEFELITNFLIKNSSTIEVEIYHHNTEYNMKIEQNSFFNKVKHYSHQKQYSNLLDDNYLEGLLSRFKISIKNPEGYLDKICSKIGSLFNTRFKSTKEDIDFLIGYICSMCYYPENPSMQLIDVEKGMQIKEALRGRFESDVRKHIEMEDSIIKINNYINYLHQIFSVAPFYEELSNYIDEYNQELRESIQGDNNIYSIISRFIERVYSSPNFDIVAANTNIDELIKQLLDLTFFVKMSVGGKVIIDSTHSKLLLKVVGNEKYNFFYLDDLDKYEDGIRKFTEVFNICSFNEKSMVLGNSNLKLVLSGDFDDENFPLGQFVELDFSNYPSDQDMEFIPITLDKDNDSISKVTYKVDIVNGSNNIKRDLLRKRSLPTMIEYEGYIKGKMR
ncbi:hypothetical protein ABER68_10560 [Paenibacillus alvei]